MTQSAESIETGKTTIAPAEDKPPAAKAIRKSFSSPTASFLVIVVTVLWTMPTFGLLVTSLRPAKDVASSGWWTVFLHPSVTLANYNSVLFENSFGATGGLMPYLVNSLAISIPGSLFPLVLAAMAAYALAWVRFKGSDVVFFIDLRAAGRAAADVAGSVAATVLRRGAHRRRHDRPGLEPR